jgi:energy-coupling factor transporter ATP-binding protein EcfA2
MAAPGVWIRELTFSDKSTIQLERGDILLVVGPNNAGKSALLRSINQKFSHISAPSPVLESLTLDKLGAVDGLAQGLMGASTQRRDPNSHRYVFRGYGTELHEAALPNMWMPGHDLGNLAAFFCNFLDTESRLRITHESPSVGVDDPTNHPTQLLYRDDDLERKVAERFRTAFGTDIILNRGGGNAIPMHVGTAPIRNQGEDRVTTAYVRRLNFLPRLQHQGDGMRSLAGILFHIVTGVHSVVLIDEPEAFLHPPQARLLGKTLVTEKQGDRQLIIATHSGDVLRGMLDADSPNVKVLRIRRDGDSNPVRILNKDQVSAMWNDPMLRYSNLLDGVFHEKVILGESNSDCRFYAATLDAITSTQQAATRVPDVMFAHCGGKDRLALAISALRQLDVPVVAIADFDVLNNEHPLRAIYEAAGGEWSEIKSEWTMVKNAIDQLKPELSADEVRKEIGDILAAVSEQMFPKDARKKIQTVLRRSSPWSRAKEIGKRFVPSGQPTQMCERLLEKLRARSIVVVEVGELEGFARSVGGHGPAWVNEVITTKNLMIDPELHQAREFVRAIFPEVHDGTNRQLSDCGPPSIPPAP